MTELDKLFPYVSMNKALMEDLDAGLGYEKMSPENQLYLMNEIFDRIGIYFNDRECYFSDGDSLQSTLEDWYPTLRQFRGRTLLNGAAFIAQGKCADWLRRAPSQSDFSRACHAARGAQKPYFENNLSKCLPLPDHVRARYNLPKLEAPRQDRLGAPVRDSREASLKISEAAINACMKSLGRPPKYPDCKVELPPEPKVRTKNWFEQTQSAMFNKQVNELNFEAHMRQVFKPQPNEIGFAPAFEYTMSEYRQAPREESS